jgi:hypothetical protein
MSEDPVTVRLVEEMVGHSHAHLAGKIEVLAEAQRGAARAQQLAAELATREHGQVRADIGLLRETVLGLSTGAEVHQRIRRWKRWALVNGIGLLIAALGVLIQLQHH